MLLICLLCRQPYLARWYATLYRETKQGHHTGRQVRVLACPAVCGDCGGKEVPLL